MANQEPFTFKGHTRDQVPHSNVHHNEQPLNEYSTPLPDAPLAYDPRTHQGDLTTEQLPDDFQPKVKKEGLSKGTKIGLALAATAGVLGTIIGVAAGSGEKTEPQQLPSASAPAQPGQNNPSEQFVPADPVEAPSDIEGLAAMYSPEVTGSDFEPLVDYAEKQALYAGPYGKDVRGFQSTSRVQTFQNINTYKEIDAMSRRSALIYESIDDFADPERAANLLSPVPVFTREDVLNSMNGSYTPAFENALRNAAGLNTHGQGYGTQALNLIKMQLDADKDLSSGDAREAIIALSWGNIEIPYPGNTYESISSNLDATITNIKEAEATDPSKVEDELSRTVNLDKISIIDANEAVQGRLTGNGFPTIDVVYYADGQPYNVSTLAVVEAEQFKDTQTGQTPLQFVVIAQQSIQ